MIDPKTALMIARYLREEDEPGQNLMTAILAFLGIIILLTTLTTYILITPFNFFLQVLYPEESATISMFKEDYDYILKDLEEYSYLPPGGNGSIPMGPNEALHYLDNQAVPEDKRLFLQNALSLVGKVDYFWGGKSSAGWNENWGKPRKVTSAGSKNSGKIMPFGLDCSGYVDWVFKTSGYGNIFAGGVGYQWGQCYAVKESELIPGDLVFKNPPGQQSVNHIGIYIGKSDNGANLYVHCAGDQGVVVNSWSGFKYFRRPAV